MAYFNVFVVALASGALVYWLTLRAGPAEPFDPIDGAGGFLSGGPSTTGGYHYATTEADGKTYVPVGIDRRSWQTRTAGILWLLIAVALAAALLAFLLYQVGSFLARLLTDYAS